jgi:hypothetical protein
MPPSIAEFLSARRRCTACGHPLRRSNVHLPPKPPPGPRAGFTASLCLHCGHVMVSERDGSRRDMTAAEKARLPNHASAAAIRKRQEQIVKDFVG